MRHCLEMIEKINVDNFGEAALSTAAARLRISESPYWDMEDILEQWFGDE